MSSSRSSKPSSVPSLADVRRERCRRSLAYFVNECCSVLSEVDKQWVPFRLWPAQVPALAKIATAQRLAILKARQLGFSWMVLALGLWLAVLHPITTILFFSQSDREAIKLLRKLRGMLDRLPDWLRPELTDPDTNHELTLANGSSVTAFPSSAGRSYTASLVVVDEADFVPDLAVLLDAVKPTVDAGGRLILISTADKSVPQSAFKNIYRSAKLGEGGFTPLFQPWHSRPDRGPEWYEDQQRYFQARDGSLDMLHQEYPATDEEALAPRSLDKRIAPEWIRQCYRPEQPLALAALPENAPAIPGLEVFRVPHKGRLYVVGADPAEGNPTSDDSALTVLDVQTGEEAAALAGKFQPSVFAEYIDLLGQWYCQACVLVERNNHGHAVLLWLDANARLILLAGHDGRVGWLSSSKGKALLYGTAADAFRHKDTVLHSFASMTQLQSIEGATLRAPTGERDDRADGYALATVAAQAVVAAMTSGQTDDERTVLRA